MDEEHPRTTNMEMPPTALMERIMECWQPLQIWLFGSRARGTARPESDWDLLIVVDATADEQSLDLTEAWRRVRDLKIPADIYPVRQDEFLEGQGSVGSLAHLVLSEGRCIHGA
jgi:predicted nucleotidyltransferase